MKQLGEPPLEPLVFSTCCAASISCGSGLHDSGPIPIPVRTRPTFARSELPGSYNEQVC